MHPNEADSETDRAAITRRLRANTARRAAQYPEFTAWLLAHVREARGWSPAELAAALKINEEALDRLALCLRPRIATWDADVATIATHVGADVDAFRQLVRPWADSSIAGVADRTRDL